jgi:hypothetical protein
MTHAFRCQIQKYYIFICDHNFPGVSLSRLDHLLYKFGRFFLESGKWGATYYKIILI